jgi:glycosyltransferase involved in cell wall biosynthesis
MEICRIFALASNHPDIINKHIGLFNKLSIEAIAKNGVEVKAIIPRPFSPPFSKYSQIPKMDFNGVYPKYYPRFWYLLPKRIFYSQAGKSYSKYICKFVEKNFSLPDLVHSFHVYLDGYGILKYCKKNNIPLVVTEHGAIMRDIWEWGNCRKKIKEVLEYSSSILCVSNDLADLVKNRGVDPMKIKVVPLGVDIYNYREKNKIKNTNSERIILFVGQFIERKGIRTLLESIEMVTAKYSDVLFFLVGHSGDLLNLVENFIKKKNLQKQVILLKNISNEKLQKIYSVADIFVLPSLAEGRPTVIYEAMASECAIVATNVSGIPEQVKDGYNGFLVEPKNPRMLTEKIIYLLDNKKELTRMGKNSRKRIVDEDWTWEGYAKRVKNIYNFVLENF